jgi:hypothetical protein
MGLQLGFQLVVDRHAVRAALEAIFLRAHRELDHACRIVFEDGSSVDSPFTCDGEEGPFDTWTLNPGGTARWMTGCPWLPIDEPLRFYLMDRPAPRTRTTPHGDEALIGDVSIHVALGDRNALVQIVSVTSSMGRCFDDSNAVRTTIQGILQDCGGRAAVIDAGPDGQIESLDRQRRADLGRFDEECPQSVDHYCNAVIAALGEEDKQTTMAAQASGGGVTVGGRVR